MSSFTDYEKHHLHKYVYTKQEVDNKMAVLKSEIPVVVKASELSNLLELYSGKVINKLIAYTK